MSSRTRAAIGIWRARNARTSRDRAFSAYAILMIGFVAIIPLARAVWLSATSEAGLSVLGSPVAPDVAMLVVAALWAGALLLGRDRGPALLSPFLTHALASSDLPRVEAFNGPVMRAGALLTALTTIVAGLIGGSMVSHGLTGPSGAALFVAVGALVGVITTTVWLAGQAFPRAATPIALSLLVLGVISVAVPVVPRFTPWGWVAAAYPGVGSHPDLATIAALAALAAGLAAVIPLLMNRLRLAELAAQAARWESATARAASMELGAAATVYQGRAHTIRRVRAVRPWSGLTSTFVIRDAIGASRTPGRFVVGVLTLASAGTLVTLAFVPGTPGWLLGAAAGLIVFAGLGPVTDGIRHAASVASDLPLYGISDGHLLLNHALFPFAVAVIVLLAVVAVCSIIIGIGALAPIISSLLLALLTLIGRIANALKGSLPTALFTPIPTPMGDLSAALRMAWALDGVLLAAAAGTSTALAFESPALLIAVAIALVGLGITRWRLRR